MYLDYLWKKPKTNNFLQTIKKWKLHHICTMKIQYKYKIKHIKIFLISKINQFKWNLLPIKVIDYLNLCFISFSWDTIQNYNQIVQPLHRWSRFIVLGYEYLMYVIYILKFLILSKNFYDHHQPIIFIYFFFKKKVNLNYY